MKKKKSQTILRKVIQTINNIKQLKVGLILLFILLLVAVFAPIIATHNPYSLESDLLVPPSSPHFLGTDGIGHDVFSMVVYGARTSLIIGVIAATISGIIGTILGGLAGFLGGKTDRVLNEFFNIFMMMPTFFLVLIIIALFGSSMTNLILVIGLTMWASNARLMRAQAMSIRERTFILSATAIGESKIQILFKHVIPNGIFPIIANTTMNIATAILIESSLSFLGLGDPNVVSWGQIISEGRSYLASAWWISTFAGFCIVLTVVAFYLVGDGLNRILSPKLNHNY